MTELPPLKAEHKKQLGVLPPIPFCPPVDLPVVEILVSADFLVHVGPVVGEIKACDGCCPARWASVNSAGVQEAARNFKQKRSNTNTPVCGCAYFNGLQLR